jgi:hypothetical protein
MVVLALTTAISLAANGRSGAAMASQPAGQESDGLDRSLVIPAEQMRFYKNPQGFVVANAWGKPDAGAHSNFIRMDGNTASGRHTHSFSYYGVVVSGTVANEPADSTADRPLGPGSYWYQRGREVHVTKCISREPCLFFVTSKGSFDYLPTR